MLKKVVVEPQLLIEHIERGHLLRGIQVELPKVLTHQRIVLLLDYAIIIFLIRPYSCVFPCTVIYSDASGKGLSR